MSNKIIEVIISLWHYLFYI